MFAMRFSSKGDRIYCSTAFGDRDIPFAGVPDVPGRRDSDRDAWRYAASSALAGDGGIRALSRQRGIGLVVPGAYVEDVLASVQAADALSAAVGSDGSALTKRWALVASISPGKGWASYVAPHAIFSVLVKGSSAWRLQDLIDVEGVALLIGLLLGWAIAAGYLIHNTPRQRLIRQVRRGSRAAVIRCLLSALVDVATGQWGGRWCAGNIPLGPRDAGPFHLRSGAQPF